MQNLLSRFTSHHPVWLAGPAASVVSGVMQNIAAGLVAARWKRRMPDAWG